MGNDMDIMSTISSVLNVFDFVDEIEYNENTKVVYSGVPGAFAEMALVEFFGEDVCKIPVASFREVMDNKESHLPLVARFVVRLF